MCQVGIPVSLGLSVLVVLSGCEPELGECNEADAIRVAYNALDSADGLSAPDGTPAYEGQAVMIQSCGYGSFCHSASGTDPADRNGVPSGLTFDVSLAASDGTVDEARVARQRRGRFRVVQEAGAILLAIDNGAMPPLGAELEPIYFGAPVYARMEGGETTPLPTAETPEGREILRNWLACGAPVIERAAPRDDGVSAVVVPPIPLPPIEDNWASIYDNLIRARGCSRALCHGADEEAGFQTTGMAETYRELVNVPASGSDCDPGQTLIVPMDPGSSLFLEKLRGDPSCGDRMPSGGIPLRQAELDAVERWIAAGALE